MNLQTNSIGLRYFFHVANETQKFPDLKGSVLPDLEEAALEAARLAQQLSDPANQYWRPGEWTMSVVDAAGLPVLAIIFGEVEGLSPQGSTGAQP